MPELKTQKNDASVEAFLNSVEDEKKRQDSYAILELMKEVTGADPVMWGTSIIGFGNYHYKYASGREGDWMVAGFSPRKQNLTVYLTSGIAQYGELLEKLGKYTTGKGCLYIKKLEHVNLDVLRELVKQSVENLAKGNVLEEG
ncbi:MAG: DUF1801 domain-containing protein [Anaerolineales bacterium]|jgi:hypothetical protein|nr:DUF1801 domain-containing protein [Anaerolineales bacterium]